MNNKEQSSFVKNKNGENGFERQSDLEESLKTFIKEFKEKNSDLIKTNGQREIIEKLRLGIANFINEKDTAYMGILLKLILREFEVKDIRIMPDDKEDTKVKEATKEYLNQLFISLSHRIG